MVNPHFETASSLSALGVCAIHALGSQLSCLLMMQYDTDDQAMVATATIYIKVLRQLIADRKFEIFVHPISPVLDVTRPTVSAFMKVLKRMIVVAIRKHSLKGKLHWLEFFQELVCNNGTSLNPDIDFDGTHMSPEYVQFLDGALKSID